MNVNFKFLDFTAPLVLKSNSSNKSSFKPDETGVATIISMGFTQEQAIKALKATVLYFYFLR